MSYQATTKSSDPESFADTLERFRDLGTDDLEKTLDRYRESTTALQDR